MDMGQNGLIHIYCGDGKGKTSAAIGMMIRAAGRGKKILLVRFLKNEDSGELFVLDQIPQIERIRMPEGYGFYWTLTDEEKERMKEEYERIWEDIECRAGSCDILVMDEFMAAFGHGLIPGASGSRPDGTESGCADSGNGRLYFRDPGGAAPV